MGEWAASEEQWRADFRDGPSGNRVSASTPMGLPDDRDQTGWKAVDRCRPSIRVCNRC